MAYWNHTQRQWGEIHRPTSASAGTPWVIREARRERLEIRRMAERMVHDEKDEHEADGELLIAPAETRPKRPPFYKVVLLNDDYTPMDFVVTILEMIFRKSHEEAVDIMMQVHQKGAGICGVYTRDVAETKVDQVIEYARINDYPLQCVVEEE